MHKREQKIWKCSEMMLTIYFNSNSQYSIFVGEKLLEEFIIIKVIIYDFHFS